MEKSAEAVVVKIVIERWKERRAEEQPREQPNHNLRMQAGMETSETQRTQQLRWLSYEANIEADAGLRQQRWERMPESTTKRKEEARTCSMK